jgi:hypothetical protein
MMALHGMVEDETQMVVVCYERIDGAGPYCRDPWRFLVMRPIKEKVTGEEFATRKRRCMGIRGRKELNEVGSS